MIIVDFNHMWNRNIHMNKADILADYSYAAHSMLQMILKVSKQFGSSKQNPLVFAVDSKPTWRHTWYAENCKDIADYDGETYKGNRVKDSDFDHEQLNTIQTDVLEAVEKFSDFFVLKVEDCEGDDIIACVANCQQIIYAFKTIVPDMIDVQYVISSDKDFKQLQSPNIHIYDPIKTMFLPEIDVERFKMIHYIIGDKADNILAIKPRTKEVTAEKMLPNIETLLATNPEMRKKFEFNKKLIDFDEIPCYIIDKIEEEVKKQKFSFNFMKLSDALTKHALNAISERIIEFKLSDQHRETVLNSQHKNQQKIAQQDEEMIHTFFD